MLNRQRILKAGSQSEISFLSAEAAYGNCKKEFGEKVTRLARAELREDGSCCQ
jgi:hypothetical protein